MAQDISSTKELGVNFGKDRLLKYQKKDFFNQMSFNEQ